VGPEEVMKMTRGLEHLRYEDRLRELVDQKALRRPYSSLPVPEGAYRKAKEGLFVRACRHRTRGNGFNWKTVDLD